MCVVAYFFDRKGGVFWHIFKDGESKVYHQHHHVNNMMILIVPTLGTLEDVVSLSTTRAR